MKKYFFKSKGKVILAFLLTTILSCLYVSVPLALTPLMNNVIEMKMGPSFKWMGIFALAWAIIIIVDYLNDIQKEKTVQEMSTNLRIDMMKNLTSYNYEEFIKEKEGKFASWFNNDLKLIQDNGFRAVFTFYEGVLQVVLACISLFFFHYSLVILTFLLAGMLAFVPNLFNKKMGKLTDQLKEANEDFLADTQDLLGSFTTFHTHNLKDHLISKMNLLSKNLAKENVSFVKGRGQGDMVITGTNIFAQFGTIIWTIILVLWKKVTPGTIFSMGNLSGIIFSNLMSAFSQLLLIKTIPSILEKDFEKGNYEVGETKSLDDFHSTVKLENVSYLYGDKKVIENVSYEFKKNGKYAIVGESGSGKSTLLNILSKRLSNYQGSIQVDGVELKDIKTSDVQKILEFVEQKPYFFNDTVGNNISLQTPYEKTTMAKLLDDLRINKFAKEEDIVVERGRNFSGGQGQRIAIGRGILFNKDILFLDEITAGLDEKSSQEVEELILNNPNLTVIMITHHLTPATKERLDGILEV